MKTWERNFCETYNEKLRIFEETLRAKMVYFLRNFKT